MNKESYIKLPNISASKLQDVVDYLDDNNIEYIKYYEFENELEEENKQLKEKIEKIEEVIKKHSSLHEGFFEDHICVDVEYIKDILKGDDK